MEDEDGERGAVDGDCCCDDDGATTSDNGVRDWCRICCCLDGEGRKKSLKSLKSYPKSGFLCNASYCRHS